MTGEEMIKLTPEELQNKIKEIRERLGMRTDVCEHCDGTGFDSFPNYSTSYPTCTWCNGTGTAPKPTT